MADAQAKILLLFWGSRGGGSLFLSYLATCLGRSPQLDVRVSLRSDNDKIDDFQRGGMRLFQLQTGSLRGIARRPWKAVTALIRHMRDLRAWRPDVVIVAMNGPFTWPLAGLMKAWWGCRLVYVAHDAKPHDGDYARRWQSFTQGRLVAQSDIVMALSGFVAKEMEAQVDRSRIRSIPLDAVYPDQRTRRSAQREDRVLRLLVMGRLIAYKGFEKLHDAGLSLKDRPGWEMTIAGDGPMKAEIRERFAAIPNVTLELNWLSEPRMRELILSHDLLLCTYSEASQSGLIADALSFGLPAIVSKQGALPEQIGWCEEAMVDDTGEALGQKIADILERPERLEEIRRAFDAVFEAHKERELWTEFVFDLLHGQATESKRNKRFS